MSAGELDVRRDALSLITNGLYVLTSRTDDSVHAITVSWVTQVSAQPPVVLVALRRNSHVSAAVRKAKRFALNILASDQFELAEKFFRHVVIAQPTGAIEDAPFRLGQARVPLLTDAVAWVECRLIGSPESPGDHELALGEVIGSGIRRQETPMVLWQTPWTYGSQTALDAEGDTSL
jgi:flavin reductase (DIM6/NTAB) family NADH-FMN oxidoreductase RutF